ncbi:MAG: hypothetical protein WCP46_00490 [Alphaproteobacteria bacterium]
MYIVIETFDPYYPNIIVDIISGFPLLFDTEADKCQKGIVVQIN